MSVVPMMQAAQKWHGSNVPVLRRIDRSRKRRVALQREVRSGVVVVGEVFLEDTAEVVLTQHDGVVQTLTSEGRNYVHMLSGHKP